MLGKVDTRARRREQTRERILKAAWRLARRDGLAGITLRDLGRAVGMRAPSLYSYFDSKFALYDAMFEQGNREFAALMAEEIEGSFEDVFRTRARRMMEFSTSDPARYQLLFQRTIPGFEPSAESYAIAVDVLEHARRFFEQAGIDERGLDLWTAITTGLVSQQLANDPGGNRWERLVDDAVDMFLQYTGSTSRGGRS